MNEKYIDDSSFYYRKYLEKLREAYGLALLAHYTDDIQYDVLAYWAKDIEKRLKRLKRTGTC